MALADAFLTEFARASDEYRPHVMWFWNAPLVEDEVRRQVRGFHQAGILDFYIHPMFGFPVDYLSEEMFEAVGWAVDEARRLGMRFWIYDEYNWPSGVAGCYAIRDHPERRQPILVRREPGEAPPGPVVGRLPDGATLSEVPQGGVCPFAQWSPFCWNQQGYTDVCDPEATRAFIELTHEAYRRHFADDFGKTLAGIFTDEVSYCLAGPYGHSDSPLPWTRGLREDFRERCGYDIGEHLESILRDAGDYRRVRVDYWRLLTDRLENAYYRQCSEWCERHGLKLTGHVSGEELFKYVLLFFGDFYRCIRWLHVPGIDSIFPRYNHHTEHYMVAPKSGSSALRHMGRERLLSETYTGSGWELAPAEMKTIFDKLAVGGVNLLQYMGAYYSVAGFRKGLPGAYPPSHNFQNAYWRFYRDFGDYVARISHALAVSRSTARVAVLYPTTAIYAEWSGSAVDMWASAEMPPRFARLQQTFLAVTNSLLDLGVDYDYLFEDVFAEAEVVDGAIRTPHARYDVLIMPAATCLPAGLAAKVCDLLADGGRVFFLNDLPEWVDGNAAVLGRLGTLLGRGPEDANAELGRYLDAGGATETGALGPAQWIVTAETTGEPRARFTEALGRALPAELRVVTELPQGVWATRRELDGTALLFLFNLSAEAKTIALPAGLDAALDPETGAACRCGEALTLEPGQALIATVAEGDLPPLPGAPTGTQEMALGEAEFGLLEPNLCVASWEVRCAEGDAWVPVGDHRFPEARPVAPGEAFELRWSFDRREAAGPLSLVTEDLGEPFEVSVNGRPVQGLEPCRVWDWRNLSADVAALLQPGRNEVRLRSRTPAWEGPHGPPMLALRGEFAVRAGALGRPAARLGAGSWVEQGFPHYAGTARYRWEVDLGPPAGPVFLEADDLAVIGVPIVNGQRLSPRLWRPYRWEVSAHLRPGPNEILVEVTSTSANLLGRTDLRFLALDPAWTPPGALQPAGLLTPLRLRW